MLKAGHVCSRAGNKAKNTENFRMNEVSCENLKSKFLYQQIIERLRCINNNAFKFSLQKFVSHPRHLGVLIIWHNRRQKILVA